MCPQQWPPAATISGMSQRMDRTDRKRLGDRIRALRKARGLSMPHLATLANISHSYVRSLETGDKEAPSLPVIVAIANALGTTLDEIVGFSKISEVEERIRREQAVRVLLGEEGELVGPDVLIRVTGRIPANAMRWMSMDGEEYDVAVPLAEMRGRSTSEVFALEVSGDCLLSHRIASGDVVVCEWANGRTPRSGELVVVRIGSEYTLKEWYWVEGVIELRDGEGNVILQTEPSERVHVEGYPFYLARRINQPR